MLPFPVRRTKLPGRRDAPRLAASGRPCRARCHGRRVVARRVESGTRFRASVGPNRCSCSSRAAGSANSTRSIKARATPEEIRGEFCTIPTGTPGVRFAEHLPRLARISDRYAVIENACRTTTSIMARPPTLQQTGQFHALKSSNPRPTPNDFPTTASFSSATPAATNFPYSAVSMSTALSWRPVEPSVGQFGGFLGRGDRTARAGRHHRCRAVPARAGPAAQSAASPTRSPADAA